MQYLYYYDHRQHLSALLVRELAYTKRSVDIRGAGDNLFNSGLHFYISGKQQNM